MSEGLVDTQVRHLRRQHRRAGRETPAVVAAGARVDATTLPPAAYEVQVMRAFAQSAWS